MCSLSFYRDKKWEPLIFIAKWMRAIDQNKIILD